MDKIKRIREYLGKIIPGGILVLSYDQYSLGWKLGVKIAKEEIKEGNFILLTNTAVSFRKFCTRLESSGVDVIKEGNQGNLAVINVFGEDIPYDFVYTIDNVDENTFVSKYAKTEKQIAEDYNLKERSVLHVFATIDALYERFGIKTIKRMIQARILTDEKLVKKGYMFWDIFMVNRDVVPKDLHSWMITISDYAIFTTGILKENEFIENVAILKGLSKKFEPAVLQMRTSTVLTPRNQIYI